jgi:hypothetical protein
MPTTGPNLGLTISDTAGAGGWDWWMNADLALLDAVVHLDVKSRVIATPPGSPAEGDRYFIAASRQDRPLPRRDLGLYHA